MDSCSLDQAHRDSFNRSFYLPRLSREYYRGDAVVLWTLTIRDRAKGWLTPGFHAAFREILLHTASREGLACPIYCLMPDHIHFVWTGLRAGTDQRHAIAFLRIYLKPELIPARFQPQAHDRVLRQEQRRRNSFAKICHYTASNPVRANLAARVEDWPYTGCIIPGYPKMNPLDEKYWPKFWRIYFKLRGISIQ